MEGSLVGLGTEDMVDSGILKPNFRELIMANAESRGLSLGRIMNRETWMKMDLDRYYMLRQGLATAQQQGDAQLESVIRANLSRVSGLIAKRYGDILQ